MLQENKWTYWVNKSLDTFVSESYFKLTNKKTFGGLL